MGSLRSIGFHAEKLHEDAVWRRLQRIARWMARNDMQATFFVYPFRAQVAGSDITDRVQTLASLGHEIGQHTHFYAGAKVEKPDKRDDLTDENIIHCLHRDFETLKMMGFSPKGFTAGGWLVNETVWDTLVDLGFVYDCSVRFPNPKKSATTPFVRWQAGLEFYTNARGRILCVPTTCSLGEWFRWARRLQVGTSKGYQLIYLHDYDLLSTRVYFMMWLLLKRVDEPRSAYEIYAEEIGDTAGRDEDLSSNRTTETRLRRSEL